jgi:ribonuclease HII
MSFLVCGIDEVGRGSFAGPLIAAAAVFASDKEVTWLPKTSPLPNLKDSKAYASPEKREAIYKQLMALPTLVDFGIGEASVEIINERGIDYANALAFHSAITALKTPPNWLLVDGSNPVGTWAYSQQEFAPKGDSKWWPVSAASVIAKVVRDKMMAELATEFPGYGWDHNAGYGTEEHQEAIRRLGPTIHHRIQFIKNVLTAAPKEKKAATKKPRKPKKPKETP